MEKFKRLFKGPQKIILLQLVFAIFSAEHALSQTRPAVYPSNTSDMTRLKENVASLMKLSVQEVIDLVPDASGINFVGCPNCNGGGSGGRRA